MQKSPKLQHLRLPGEEIDVKEEETFAKKLESLYYEPAVLKAFSNICFIANLLKKKDKDDKVSRGSLGARAGLIYHSFRLTKTGNSWRYVFFRF